MDAPSPPIAGTAPPGSGTVRATRAERLLAGIVAVGILAVLATAASLRASPTGLGTHRQLGLPNCGWIASANAPCPTCGMTTAFAHAAHARPLAAFVAQPMGAAWAVLAAALFWGALHIAVTGSRLGTVLVRMLRPRVLWVFLALWGASWIYKVVVHRMGA